MDETRTLEMKPIEFHHVQKEPFLSLKSFKISWLMIVWKITKTSEHKLNISKIMIKNKMAVMWGVKTNTWLIKMTHDGLG